MKRARFAAWAALAAGLIIRLAAAGPPPQSEFTQGKEVFGKRCTGCHALDMEKEGPRLRGVFGRKAAAIQSFAYSDALRKSQLTWDSESLNKWLEDPSSLAPGTDMEFRVTDASERGAIITYLKQISR